ncbi:hypothetical protein RN001_008610 [Aquatica leii]|uniref:Uncharacterized protein n=1 Tax=Aquatica leii TaxID=1421715 RepID=A0AAN7PAJ0_9COLE|nr:hypothetical protein RN001_008610 [Aquatica leii]
MLADERKYVRKLSLRRILKCRRRASNCNQGTIRVFQVPKLNFKAEEYIYMIDWQSSEVTKSPLIKHISIEDLENMILDVPDNISILKLPCHTQAVERCIKMVTEASSSVCSNEARDGLIRAKLASRSELPKFETKKQFIH